MNDQGIFARAITYLFGANWKTSLSGFIAILSAIIHGKPEIIEWIPEPYRGVIWAVSEYVFLGAAATFVVQAKTKTVTGGTTQQTVSGAKAQSGTQTLVDHTLLASKQSGEKLSPDQEEALHEANL